MYLFALLSLLFCGCFGFQIVEIHTRHKLLHLGSATNRLRFVSGSGRSGDFTPLAIVNGTPTLFTLRILTNISEAMYEHERTLEFAEVDRSGRDMFAAVFQNQLDVVVAFKGTDFDKDADLQADLEMFACCPEVDKEADPRGPGPKATCGDAQEHCNITCREQAARGNHRSYYLEAMSYMESIVTRWPPTKYNIWLTGHSLGGALATTVSAKTQYRAVAFSSPGDQYYAKVMGFDLALKNTDNIWHYYNDCDQLAQGSCVACKFVVPVEVVCHMGTVCICKSKNIKRKDTDKHGCLQAFELDNPYPDHNIQTMRPLLANPLVNCPCVSHPRCVETTCTGYN